MSGAELTPVCRVWVRANLQTDPLLPAAGSPTAHNLVGKAGRLRSQLGSGAACHALTRGHLRHPVLLGSWTEPTALAC